jgi:hypothetical protein
MIPLVAVRKHPGRVPEHHLDARQVAWQRATVRAALRCLRLLLSRRLGFMIGFFAGCGLLDVLKAQQQLILGKRFGPAAEPMTLHLLDDLFEPLGAGALRQQHRLQRAGIVGKRICRKAPREGMENDLSTTRDCIPSRVVGFYIGSHQPAGIRFERELGCTRLKPQVQRLFESIATTPPAATIPSVAAPPIAPPRGEEPKREEAKREESRTEQPPALATKREQPIVATEPQGACVRDAERLAQLRGNPSLDAIARFDRELSCERLRPQLRRLRESTQ